MIVYDPYSNAATRTIAGQDIGVYYDVDTESIIRPGDFAGDQKPCIGTSEVTFGNYFLPMIPKLKTEVQDHKHIIPEDSMDVWVRGGLPSRQIVRNLDYMRRVQEKK